MARLDGDETQLGAPLPPSELDQLEDALEALFEADAHSRLAPGEEPSASIAAQAGLSAPVRAHLDAYADVLQQVRQALDGDDVDDALLAEVFAEARESTVTPTVPSALDSSATTSAAARAAARAGGGWSWLAPKLWVPTLALAGSAAAVLLWMQPAAGPAASDATAVAAAEPAERRALGDGALALAKDAAPADGPARGEGLAAADDEAPLQELAAAPPPASARPAAAEEQAADLAANGALGGQIEGDEAAKPREPAVSPGKNAAGGGGAPKGAPAPAPEPKRKADDAGASGAKDAQQRESTASGTPEALLAQADAARRSGQCGAARSAYERALAAGSAAQRALAHAGLSLCHEAEGRYDLAKASLDRAVKLDAAIVTWVERERERTPGARRGGGTAPGVKASKRSAKAATEPRTDMLDDSL